MKASVFTPLLVCLSFFKVFSQSLANDECSGSIDLGIVPYCSTPAQFSNLGATTSIIDLTDNVPSCWANLAERDVWFKFKTPTDGSVTDLTIDVWGNVSGNGTLKLPQLAVYRGSCSIGGLAELACAAAPANSNELHLDLFSLTPGATYYLRINDYTPGAGPGGGTFRLCLKAFEPDLIIGTVPGTTACSGTLWDSGGPGADYSNQENKTFVICPVDSHQCIRLQFVSYSIEKDFDFLRIYDGIGTSGALLQTITGSGQDFTYQASSDCVTLHFTSDNSVVGGGFELKWQCSPDLCDAPPPLLPNNATCDKAILINGCESAPQFMPLSPGKGTQGFLVNGVNQGCFVGSFLNHSFFYFQAQADGLFGFAVQSGNPDEATDIDFNVWGPIPSVDQLCAFAESNQPIRSSWAFGPDLTGLADVHPVLGTPVTDDFDCGSPVTPGANSPSGMLADDFVRRIEVKMGEIYLILLDDFDGNIKSDGISIDFSGTTQGVLGLPNPPITVSNDTVSCNGQPVQLQVSGGVAYTWTPAAGLSCNTCPNPVASPFQTMNYQVQVVGICQMLTDTVTVTVAPDLNVFADTSICIGQSVVLAQNIPQAGTTYTWSPDDGSLSDPSDPNPIATPQQTTTYTLVADNGFCTETKTITVTVVSLELNLNAPADTSICKGQALTFTASTNPPNLPVSWSPLTHLQVQPGGGQAVATPVGTIVYTATVAQPGCVQKQDVVVRVDSLPPLTPIFPQDTFICSGQTLLLFSPPYSGTQHPNLQFTWNTSTGQTFPNSQYFFVVNPKETTTYYRQMSKGACVRTDSATVHILPVPELSIVPENPQICTGETIGLTVNGVGGLSNPSWSPLTGLSCILCTNPTASPAETTTFQFSATVSNGCTAKASVTVEVNTPPVFAFPDDTLCAGQTIVLNNIVDPTAAYAWSSFPPGFSSTEAQPTHTPAQTTTYFVTIENGCTVQQQFTLQVVPAASLVLSEDLTVCKGASAQLTASGSFPGTFQWSNGAMGQVTSVKPDETTTFSLVYRYPLPNPRCELKDSVTVSVQGEVAQVQFPSDTLLCPGEGVLLNSVETPGATYSWTSNPSIFSSNEAIPPVFYPDRTARYFVSTVLGSCSLTYRVDIVVFNPQLKVSNDTSVCAGEPVRLSANALLTGDYFWEPGGAGAAFVDTVNATAQYVLHFLFGEGCELRDTVTVTVLPNFSVEIVADPSGGSINAGDMVELDALVKPIQNLNGFMFNWFEDLVNSIGTGKTIQTVPSTSGTSVAYTVVAQSPNGCLQRATLVLRVVQPDVQIPNAFTPNGDGANDSFGLALIEGVANIEKMEIYSRWGQKVFESREPKARWDGFIDGNPAPSDVYVYVIFWRGGDGALRFAKGELTLLR
jgi:gliding motility-associated-like protein